MATPYEGAYPHLTDWYLAMQPYCFTVQHHKRSLHANVVFFSGQAMNTYLDEHAGLGAGGGGQMGGCELPLKEGSLPLG